MFAIPLLTSPIGRWILIVLAGVVIVGGVYVKVKDDARRQVEAEIAQRSSERVNEAVRAGDALRDPQRVRELDKKFCRDC